jgi:hypothetical protein
LNMRRALLDALECAGAILWPWALCGLAYLLFLALDFG